MKYIQKRLLYTLITFIVASIPIFSITRLIPGDPAVLIAGVDATPELVESIKIRWGLNEPIYVQYFIWIRNMLSGDFGRSIETTCGVLQELIPRFRATVELGLLAIIIAISLGLFLGIVSAVKKGSVIDHIFTSISLFGISMPAYWLGLMAIALFSVRLRWLPTGGRGSFSNIILPAFVLSTWSIAIITRITRASMWQTLGKDYIRTARAKGLRENTVVLKHALKNALIPVITIIGLESGTLLSGAVLTETVFSWPGIGRQLAHSVLMRDFAMVQGALILITSVYLLLNFATDVLYAYVDPRIHYR